MAKIDSTVSVVEGSKLAVEMVSNGWFTPTVIAPAAAALITISVVGFTTWLNYRNSKKMIEHQALVEQARLKADHENKVSEYRHGWLQDVRHLSADVYTSIERLKILLRQKKYYEKEIERNRNIDGLSEDLMMKVYSIDAKNHDWVVDEIHSVNKDFLNSFSKLSLMFEPDDIDFISVIKPLDINADEYAIGQIDSMEFIENMQDILKREWEVTKGRSWVAS